MLCRLFILISISQVFCILFYDYASGPGNSFYEYTDKGLVPLSNSPDVKSFKSFGIELLSDFHVLRIPYMISAGVQSAWKSFGEKPAVSLIFSIDLYGMSIGRRNR